MTQVTSLLVLPSFPLADTGIGQRSLLLLEAAAGLGPVHVVLLADHMPQDAAARLPQAASVTCLGRGSLQRRGLARHVPHGALRLLAPGLLYRVDPDLQRRLTDLIDRTGARVVMFRYAPTYCATGLSRQPGLAVLVDIDDRDDQKYATRLTRMLGAPVAQSWPVRRVLARLAEMLKRRLSQASLLWFAGAEDVWNLDGVTSSVLPNVPMVSAFPDDLAPPSQGDSVLFVGISNHIPNQDGVRWFLDGCWSDLHRQCPELRLRIVGRGPDWPLMAQAYPQLKGVDFVGPVEDLQAEYARARICICPVREGGGSKIKVVEAAAYGRPIVGLPHAFRGFDAGILGHARVAEDAAGFVAACVDLARDGARADRDGQALRDWQRAQYSRPAALERIRADILAQLPRAVREGG